MTPRNVKIEKCRFLYELKWCETILIYRKYCCDWYCKSRKQFYLRYTTFGYDESITTFTAI